MRVTDLATKRYLVYGRVQGVFFRESTRKVALPLGIDGWAMNLPDGSVEVVARGIESSLRELESYLDQGPRWAKVSRVVGEPFEGRVEPGFVTGNR